MDSMMNKSFPLLLERTWKLRVYEIIKGKLYQSGFLVRWKPVREREITVVFDLEGGLDKVIPKPEPDTLVYVCHPIKDGELPNMKMMSDLAELGCRMIKNGHKVLSHCFAGVNRASLMNGLIIHKLQPDKSGKQIVNMIRKGRPGALTNEVFEKYLVSLKRRKKNRR